MERTCILVKPDGVCKKHIGQVIERLESAGLQLLGLKMLRLTKERAENFYQEHHGKPFYDPLVAFMTSAPIVASAWQGEKAIEKARALMGSTDSPNAPGGTLRRQYGTDNRHNLVHGSDSARSAEREIAFFFKPEDLYSYQPTDWEGLAKVSR